MKQFLATTLLLVSVLFVRAQRGPQFPELIVKEDYAKAEPLFLQAIEWLNETDMDQQLELRQMTSAFVFNWIQGSPTVRILIGPGLFRVIKDNPPLGLIYMGNYAAFCIKHPDNHLAWDAAKEGFVAMIKVYNKGIGIKKNKDLRKLAEAVDAGKLEEYMNINMTKDNLK